ncbi:hypothetical protein AAG570_004968 [Ranatra chinensis]|uniref:Uncharacterized protein n=1 Tax=Ranatra chinensis TaxID=642074 RepID=A0ABD0XZ38_9HEMI
MTNSRNLLGSAYLKQETIGPGDFKYRVVSCSLLEGTDLNMTADDGEQQKPVRIYTLEANHSIFKVTWTLNLLLQALDPNGFRLFAMLSDLTRGLNTTAEDGQRPRPVRIYTLEPDHSIFQVTYIPCCKSVDPNEFRLFAMLSDLTRALNTTAEDGQRPRPVRIYTLEADHSIFQVIWTLNLLLQAPDPNGFRVFVITEIIYRIC